jgi:hypothetical protein
LLARYYALNIYYYNFYDKTVVMRAVLPGVTGADQIYSDENYGLDSY